MVADYPMKEDDGNMLLLSLDEADPQPRYTQIIQRIIEKIENRILMPGEKIPSTRSLAQMLGVHRSTVSLAYQELWALGYVDLCRGACPRVRQRVPLAPHPDEAERGGIDWETWSSPETRQLFDTYRKYHGPEAPLTEDTVDFRRMLDDRLFPMEGFRSALNRVVSQDGAELLTYGEPEGYYPLRACLADHMRRYGMSVVPEEVLITNGAQQGLDLVLRMMGAPGRRIVVETPTYRELIPLIRYRGMVPVEIPMTPEGMDLTALESELAAEKAHLIYTMPNFHNPTGISTGQAHRERLLALSEQYGVPILEDGFQEEMKYFGKAVLPIKSMDRNRHVIYCGTFSKVLFPGARVGWLIADRGAVERMTAHRFFGEMVPGQMLQAALSEFCTTGGYDRHVSRMHRVFRKRMETLLRELRQRILPQWAQWEEPCGGYLIWLRLEPAGVADWRTHFEGFGLRVAFGDAFFASDNPHTHIRLSIAGLNEAEIISGIGNLEQALRSAHENGGWER